MPKYYGIHLDMLENMAVALKDFAPAAAYSGMDGHGVMTLIHDYLVNNYDNDGFDMSQHLTRYSPMTTTGSGMGLFHTPLDKESLSKLKLEELPNGLDMTSLAVKRMLGDKELMQNEPMLRAYLSYAASQFRNAELERDDSTGYMSEVATGVCSMLAGQFTRLPTDAELEQLRQNDPGAYKVAETIMDYLNAHAEYCAPDEGNEADPAVQKAEITKLVAGGPLRYAASAGTKESLRALGESMQTEGRSKEWKNLKSALTGKMMSTEQVFDAVESYLKGKKSVKNDPRREASVDLALNALAIAAKNGDSVAKARAQILADRFNKVRGVQPGHRDFIDLSKYGAPEQAQAEPRHDAQMYRGRSRASPKGRSAWRRRCGRNRSPN